MNIIGDLSRADVAVLGRHAITAKTILEFGVGASTQVLANFSDPSSDLVSVDTEPKWVEITKSNLKRLGIHKPVYFEDYGNWLEKASWVYDLVFVDGRRDLRVEFARSAWPMLTVGGYMLWHDCRRPVDAQEIINFVGTHRAEVDTLTLSAQRSNLAVIRKGPYLTLEDWHAGKQPWELGIAPLPSVLPWEVS